MSTRATYEFADKAEAFTVYKHHDGYPEGAAVFLTNATRMAWEPPRFEAADFGAAFIAANKQGGGGVYLTKSRDEHGDTEFHYVVTFERGKLQVAAYERDERDKWNGFFAGPLEAFAEKFKQ